MTDSNQSTTRGLFDGFEGYRSRGRNENAQILTESLVVPDANVLLNLYRYTADSRENLLSVLAKLSTHLWVPHQVLVEFWRNRESVMRDPGDSEKTISVLDEQCNKATNDLRAWANRVSLPPDVADRLVGKVRAGFTEVADEVRTLSETVTTDFNRDTSLDLVLRELEPILDGRVGSEMEEAAYKKAIQEGLRRVGAQEPPGYKDKKKDDVKAAGDYLVWEQLLLEASASGKDVLFITGDTKEDWWRMEDGQRRGPRIELVDEMRRRAGVRFHMLRPSQLLEYAQDILEVAISADSVRAVDLVDTIVSQSEETLPGGGWTVDALSVLLVKLNDEAKVQADVIRTAVEQSGFVSREQVYELGGYPPERSLRGFTRPVNRIAQFVKSLGMADADAVDVLWAVYNEESPELGWASGFRIHPEVLPLLERISPRLLSKSPSLAQEIQAITGIVPD